MEQTTQHSGKVVSIIGPVVDIEFEGGHLPAIYNAIRVASDSGQGGATIDVILEVEQHLGENRVRTVAMEPTDGMQRGMTALDLGDRDLRAGRPRDARPRAERARPPRGLPRPAGERRRSAGRSTVPRRRSRISPPSS